MKRIILISIILINLTSTLVGQNTNYENDTLITLTLTASFLPGPYSVKFDFEISKRNKEYIIVRKKFKWINIYNQATNNYTFSKVVDMGDTITKAENKEILFMALSDLFNHSKDSLFSVKLKKSDWKAIKNNSTKGNNNGINELVIDSFKKSQGKIIKININNFCFDDSWYGPIDGCPLTLVLNYYSQNHKDSIELKGYYCMENEIGRKYNLQWLQFYLTLNKYQELNDIISLFGLKEFLLSKEILYGIIFGYIHDIKYKCPPQLKYISFFNYDSITHFAYIPENFDSSTKGLVEIYEIKDGEKTIYFKDTVVTGKPGFYIDLIGAEYQIIFWGRKKIYFEKYNTNNRNTR